MFHLLLKGLVLLVLYLVVRLFYRLILNKIGMNFYEKQGLKSKFFPFLGMFGLYAKWHPENKLKSNLGLIKRLAKEDPYAPGFVTNSALNGGSVVCLTNPDYVKEFVAKEDKFHKINFDPSTTKYFGMFLKNGKEATLHRTIFNEIFHYQNLKEFFPLILKEMRNSILEFNKTHSITKEKFTKIDLRDLFPQIFEKIVYLLIFGTTSIDRLPSGHSLYSALGKINVNGATVRMNIFYNLFPWICMKFKPLPLQRETIRLVKEIGDVVVKLYKEREVKGELKNCVLDNCIKYNQQCKNSGNLKEMLSMEDIVGNVNLFMIAGTDTSQNTSKMSLCQMAEQPEVQQIVADIAQRIYDKDANTTIEKLEQDKMLQLWIKEALRMNNQNARTWFRVAQEDVELKSLKIRKGDMVIAMTNHLRYDPKAFQNPEAFDINRFSEDKKIDKDVERYNYNPFWQGRRSCLGKNLGEMMVMALTTMLVHFFEIKKPDGVEYYREMFAFLQEKQPFIDVKLRSIAF